MEYLKPEEFFKKYDLLYPKLETEFFKFETLQEYQEYGVSDWNQLDGKQIHEFIVKAQSFLITKKDRFDFLKAKGVTSKRIRYITFPISKYVLRQFSSFVINSELGEQISILENLNALQNSKKDFFRDFIIFDKRAILIHNYVDGKLEGAWFSENISDLQPYLEIKIALEKVAVSLTEFISNYNMSFSKLI